MQRRKRRSTKIFKAIKDEVPIGAILRHKPTGTRWMLGAPFRQDFWMLRISPPPAKTRISATQIKDDFVWLLEPSAVELERTA